MEIFLCVLCVCVYMRVCTHHKVVARPDNEPEKWGISATLYGRFGFKFMFIFLLKN